MKRRQDILSLSLINSLICMLILFSNSFQIWQLNLISIWYKSQFLASDETYVATSWCNPHPSDARISVICLASQQCNMSLITCVVHPLDYNVGKVLAFSTICFFYLLLVIYGADKRLEEKLGSGEFPCDSNHSN